MLLQTLRNGFSKFFALESASSIMLFGSTVLAIILANSNLSSSYFSVLETYLTISLGEFTLSKTLIHWVNDGLMVIFFFVIGLEIKRELLAGELKTIQQSALPVISALGGMIIPAVIFLSIHNTERGMSGWGIPMATDIAFSLGVLQLLGKRAPLSLKIFLTAFAIIDDLGAIIIIAFFYSSQILLSYILIAFGIYALLILMNIFKIKANFLLLAGGIVIWYLFLKAGIHPTIAGVLLALVTPATREIGNHSFAKGMKEVIDDFEKTESPGEFLNRYQVRAIEKAEVLTKKVQPYLQNLEHSLHAWVAFFIMPVFALANAGVTFNFKESGGIEPLAFHIGIALLVGKVIGITGFSYLGVKLKLAKLPAKTTFNHIFGVSFLGGIGFTMALFINTLAYEHRDLLDSAKIGIIFSSLIAGTIGYFLLKYSLRNMNSEISPM